MGVGRKLPVWNQGDPILADDLTAVSKAAQRAVNLEVGPGLELLSTPTGRILSLKLPRSRVALSTTIIFARSGTTKGHGTATLYADKGDGSGVDVILQAGVKVWNPFSTPIPPGKWLVLAPIDGLLQVIGGDC